MSEVRDEAREQLREELAERLAERINPRPYDSAVTEEIKRLLLEFADASREGGGRFRG
jgi:hypothetical protein